MNTQLIKIDDRIYNAIVEFKPRKRTIIYKNKLEYVNFDFYTYMLIPIYSSDNFYARIGYPLIFAKQKLNSEFVHPIRYPHVAPNNMTLCIYLNENSVATSVNKLIENECNTFWNSKNHFFMDDIFTETYVPKNQRFQINKNVKYKLKEIVNKNYYDTLTIQQVKDLFPKIINNNIKPIIDYSIYISKIAKVELSTKDINNVASLMCNLYNENKLDTLKYYIKQQMDAKVLLIKLISTQNKELINYLLNNGFDEKLLATAINDKIKLLNINKFYEKERSNKITKEIMFIINNYKHLVQKTLAARLLNNPLTFHSFSNDIRKNKAKKELKKLLLTLQKETQYELPNSQN